MKRSGREHKPTSLKRIKSVEGRIEPLEQKETVTSTPFHKCPQLQPGFGFNRGTRQHYKPKAKRGACGSNRCQTIQKLANLSKSQNRETMQSKAEDTDKSLETDTLDLKPEHEVEKRDEMDDACPKVDTLTKLSIPSQQFSQTYPPTKRSSSKSLNDDDLETDIIILQQIRESQLVRPPREVPVDYSDMKPKGINEPLVRLSCVDIVWKKYPKKESTVQIHHEYKGQTLQDEFGARLETYKTKTKDGKKYYRHIFYDIEKGAPADEMKLQNDNEIVLLNEVFVPDLTHDEVMKIFQAVKVDGETRFRLVMRYVDSTISKKTWKWFVTSALLYPDDHPPHTGDRHPKVEDEQFKVLPNNETEMVTTYRLRVKGTKEFIVIEDTKVSVSLTACDVCLTSRYSQDATGQVTFKASLRAIDKQNFISVSGKKIKIVHDPFWFHMYQKSADIAFYHDDKFLAFNRRKRVLTTDTTECLFEKIPVDGEGLDELDGEPVPSTSAAAEQIDQEDHTSNEEHQIEQHSKLVYTSSQKSTASSSHDSFHPFSQSTSYSDFVYADEDSSGSMTSSQSSEDNKGFESSGYLTSGSHDLSLFKDKPKTPNTPMACLSMNDMNTQSTLK